MATLVRPVGRRALEKPSPAGCVDMRQPSGAQSTRGLFAFRLASPRLQGGSEAVH
jgi:hypothetical protein